MSTSKCNSCEGGTIQHTSFINEDETTTHVYGCNRCSNGWSEVEDKVLRLSPEEMEILTQFMGLARRLDPRRKNWCVSVSDPLHDPDAPEFKPVVHIHLNGIPVTRNSSWQPGSGE